jgi:hypothetical protein
MEFFILVPVREYSCAECAVGLPFAGCLAQEPVGLRANLLQIRLDGPYSAAFLANRTTIALQNRRNLSSPSKIFASVS